MKGPATLQGWEARQRYWKNNLKELERRLSHDRLVAEKNSVVIVGLRYVMRDRMLTSRYQEKIRYIRRRLQKWASVLREQNTRLKRAKHGECIWCGKTDCTHLNPKPILLEDLFHDFRVVHSDFEEATCQKSQQTCS